MITKLIALLCLSLPSVSIHAAPFAHDRGVVAGQKGDWEKSYALLTEELANSPENPSLLYDTGIAAYKLGKHEQAYAYFSNTAESEKAPNHLKEQAYFNAGNCGVQLQKLEQAISAYESALALDPQDERARHNLELVKKMLEQQKQQEKEQKKDEQKNNNQDKNDQEKKEKEREQDNQDNKGSQDESEKDQPEHEPGEEQKGAGKEKREEKGTGQKQSQNKEKKEGEQEGQSQGSESNKQEKSESASDQSHKNKQRKEGPGLEPQLAQLLENQEKKDAQLNKQLMKAAIGSRGAHENGKNCW